MHISRAEGACSLKYNTYTAVHTQRAVKTPFCRHMFCGAVKVAAQRVIIVLCCCVYSAPASASERSTEWQRCPRRERSVEVRRMVAAVLTPLHNWGRFQRGTVVDAELASGMFCVAG